MEKSMNTAENGYNVEQLSLEILQLVRDTLLVSLRFMDTALCQWIHVPFNVAGIASDGKHFYYHPRYILKKYKDSRESLSQDYLHVVLHWIFNHPFVGKAIDRERWNLACDITVENLMIELELFKESDPFSEKRIQHLEVLKKGLKTLTAEQVYRDLLDHQSRDVDFEMLKKAFYRDDHQIWYAHQDQENATSEENKDNEKTEDQEQDQAPSETKSENVSGQSSSSPLRISEADFQEIHENWKRISDRVKMEIETFSKSWGKHPNSLSYNLDAIHHETYDYNAFLKRFAVLGEEMQINDDEFDYIYYTYGLKLYDNIPLIEPLEYKEIRRVKEFVIALDTSGSCSGSMIQAFLNKTYNILKQTENFFTSINLHIIQCDDAVRSDEKITNQVEFDRFLKHLDLKGEGGTDFRPVFKYVDELLEEKAFENLKGLIYFTDGFGTYPKKPPKYDTAFVFLGDEFTNTADVPAWAIKMILPKQYLTES